MSNPTGTGATLAAVGQQPFVGRIMKIGGWERSVEALDDTALKATQNPTPDPRYQEFVFSEIVAHGAITVTVLTDGAMESLPDLGSVQTWTLTFRSGRQISGSAAIVQSVSSELENNVRRLETFQLQFDGKEGPTITS